MKKICCEWRVVSKFVVAKRIFAISRAIALPLLFTTHCLYAMGIGGFYELEYIVRKTPSSDLKWEMETPRHRLELKLWADPVNGAEIYTQLSASSNDWRSARKRFFLDRAWGKYWKRPFEIYFLTKEERHWFDSPLLGLVNQSKASNNKSSDSVKFYLSDITGSEKKYGVKLNLIATKDHHLSKTEWWGYYYDIDGETVILKLNASGFKNDEKRNYLDFGGLFIRKNYKLNKHRLENNNYTFLNRQTGYSEVLGGDIKLIFKGISFTTEIAGSTNKLIGVSGLSDRIGFSSEVRDVKVGPFVHLTKYYYHGRNFRSEVSERFSGLTSGFGLKTDPDFNKKGFYTETSFLMPGKLITFTYKHDNHSTNFDGVDYNKNLRGDYAVRYLDKSYRNVWHYGELYSEFTGGLKGKVGFEYKKDRYGNFPASFFEISGETQFVYARFQTRFKDINSKFNLGERFILGGELKANLTDRLQAYFREVFVHSSHLKKDWDASFWQLRYYVGWDIEIYMEYGEGWQTGDLAFSTSITDNQYINTTQLAKIYIKVNF